MLSRTSIEPAALAALLLPMTNDGRPLYRELAASLLRIIADGTLSVGSRLPPERALSVELGLSRVTVTSAYRELREQGWADAVHGAGTFVAVPAIDTSWGSMIRSASPGVLELVNAAPEASPFLAPAYQDAVGELGHALSGQGYQPRGTTLLRAAIAARYTARGMPTSPEQIVVTAGASDAAHAVFETFVRPGHRVLIEHPTYPNVVEMIDSAGALAVPVPIDAADPDAFVADADRAARQNSPTVAYLMPDFSNPSGARSTEDGRRRLAATLTRHGILTIVDEVAADLDVDGSPPIEPFGVPVPAAATISIGSMSKTVWGGFRVGWIRAEVALAGRIARTYARRQLSVSTLDQLAAVRLFAIYDEVLFSRRTWLRTQRDLLVENMERTLPDWTFRIPSGGLSLWCTLPNGLTSGEVVTRAAGRDLLMASGTRFGTGYAFDDHIRIPYTRPEAELSAAVRILAQSISDPETTGLVGDPTTTVV